MTKVKLINILLNMKTIGIDPGSMTGIAILHAGVLLECFQKKKHDAIAIILERIKTYGVKTAFVEKPRYAVLYNRPWLKKASALPAHVFPGGRASITVDQYKAMMDTAGASAAGITAGQIKLAQNVGQNIEFTNEIIFNIREKRKEVRIVEVAPKPRKTKWEINFWCRIFNWQKTRAPGEHARDAACIAYLNGG